MAASKKIILVEDNLADAELIKMALNKLAYDGEIVHCFDGQELLDLLEKELLVNISFILLDLNLPKISGTEILQRFREDVELRKLPVVVFTSSKHSNDIQNCYDLGANAYVRKPMDLNEFDEAIRAIASFWAEINVLASFSEN